VTQQGELKQQITQATTASIENADFLKEIRKESGLTQTEVAKLMNVSLRTYQYYETGELDITFRNTAILVQKLKYNGAVQKFKQMFDFFRL